MADPNNSYPRGVDSEARTLKIDPYDREESAIYGKFGAATHRQEVDAFISGIITVTGGLTDAQLRATPVPVSVSNFPATQPVSAISLPLPTGAATETTLAEIGADIDTIESGIITLNSLVPSAYDYIALSYTGADLTTVTWKVGGSGGTTVAIVALTYSASVLQTVTRTFP